MEEEKCICKSAQSALKRWEERMLQVEENVRIMMSRQFQTNANMKRNFEKIMTGFRAIERAFKLNCNKQIEMTETLQDFSSDMGGGLPCEQIFHV